MKTFVIQRRNLLFLGIISVYLMIAPIRPEPHLIGKLRWIMGGAEGMQLMDWLDFLMHSLPISLLLIYLVYRKFIAKT